MMVQGIFQTSNLIYRNLKAHYEVEPKSPFLLIVHRHKFVHRLQKIHLVDEVNQRMIPLCLGHWFAWVHPTLVARQTGGAN